MRFLAWLALALLALPIGAHAIDAELRETLRAKVEAVLQDAEVTAINESPIPGVYEVMLGPSLVYVSEDGGLSAFHRKKLEVRERLQRANERYLSPLAPISRWDLERIERECLAELEQLERMLPPGVEEPDVWQYLDDFGHLWEAATWDEQNRLLGLLCSAIFVEDEKVVTLVAYPAFQQLLSEAVRRVA